MEMWISYLFICLAVIMLGIALWKNVLWIYMISAVAWLGTGAFYLFTAIAIASLYTQGFAFFCFFAGIGTMIVPFVNKKKDFVNPSPYDRIVDIDNETEKYRQLRKRRRLIP